MEEKKNTILQSFSKVWKIESVLYNIGKIRIPPVAIKTVLYFIIFFILLSFNLPLINLIPGSWRYLIIPGALAFMFSKKLLDGKNPVTWMKSMVLYFIRWISGNNSINRYRKIKKPHKAGYKERIAYRIVTTLDE